MNWLVFTIDLWLLSLMVFYVNPMNDPTEPESEMNPYSLLNTLIATDTAIMENEEIIIFHWYDLYPYVETTRVTAFCLALCAILRPLFGG